MWRSRKYSTYHSRYLFFKSTFSHLASPGHQCKSANLLSKVIIHIIGYRAPPPVIANCRWLIHPRFIVEPQIILHRYNTEICNTSHSKRDKWNVDQTVRCIMSCHIIPRHISGSLIYTAPPANKGLIVMRSEERRVGKECRSRWSPYH